jgi:hypothetical protein
VTCPDNIANGVRVLREVTVALQIELVSVTSPDIFANGVRVLREVTAVLKILVG